MKFGKAKYGGESFKKRNYFSMKPNSSVVYRILPPMGDLADDGRWSVYYNIHYGYTNSNGKMRTFQSPAVKNNKGMTEVEDAALTRIRNLEAKKEAAKLAGDEAMVEKLEGVLKTYNLDSNHYMNVVDLQGNIGILKIRHKAKLALDAEIKNLRSEGIDPLSVEDGRFFVFTKSGGGRDTVFKVSVHTEKRDVPGVGRVEIQTVHSIDDALSAKLSSEAAELDKLFKRPTAEEVQRIVKEGAKAVDEILDAKSSNDQGSSDVEDHSDVQEVEEEVKEVPKAMAKMAASAPAVNKTVNKVAKTVAKSETSMEDLSSMTAPTAALSKKTTVSAPKTVSQSIDDMNVDDFLADLERK